MQFTENQIRLIKQYGEYIIPRKKSEEVLLNEFIEKLPLKEIKITDIGETSYKMLIYNIGCYIKERNIDFDISDVEFSVFKLLNEGIGKEYYSGVFIPTQIDNEKSIYIIWEKNFNYISCNCTKLSLELNIAKSISEEDIQNKSIRLFEFLSSIEVYSKKLYNYGERPLNDNK